MCQRITCRQCGKPSFAGCGRHVESVLGDVPPAQRCQGHAAKRNAAAGPAGPSTGLRKLLDCMRGGRARRQP
jgi:hypothetical protein